MSRLVRFLRLGMATVGALAATCAPASAATSAEFFGVNLQPLQQNPDLQPARWGSYLGQLQQGRMALNRIQADWYILEPKAPVDGVHTWDWNAGGEAQHSMDYTIGQLAMRGLRAVPTLNNSPTWARGGGSNLPDSSFSAFADYAIAYIQRYGPGGSFWAEHPELPQLPATQYELWNEANSSNFWTGQADSAAYARFLRVVYPKVKAAAPQATLMASIAWPDAANYLGQLFAAGAGGSMDAVAFHPYAPTAGSSLGLVRNLRATLAAGGRGGMPILITESGQPANYAGTGTNHAYDGPVNDATRAATLSLTGDALASSDCGVDSYLVYAVTGTETNREILSEGFMGLFGYANAAPNATGQALMRASQRWAGAVDAGRAAQNGRLVLCNQGTTAAAALLELGLSASRGSSGGCVAGAVSYDGNPLEEADLVVHTADGRTARNRSNAAGKTETCIPNGPAVDAVDVYAELPNAARSATLRCDVPVSRCAKAASVRASASQSCTVALVAPKARRERKGRKASTRVRARLNCNAYKSNETVKVKKRLKGKARSGKPRYSTKLVKRVVQPSFTVMYQPAGSKRSRKLRTITLKHGKTVTFTLRREIRKGDQLALVHQVSAKRDRLPYVRASVKLAKPLPARRR